VSNIEETFQKTIMGIFDFFKKKNKDNKSTASEESIKKPYLGDFAKTHILNQLFNTPTELRNDKWEKIFFENISEASFSCGNPQIATGPDGFAYFQLNIPEPNKEFQCYVLKHMKDDFLLEKGIGVVINSQKDQPDWVFTYGDIVNFHLNNEYYSKAPNWNLQKKEVINENEEVLVGQPSEQYLPNQTRKILSEYLKQMGVTDAKMLLMNRKMAKGVIQELVFNLTPKKIGDQNRYESIMNNIGWFLPRQYSYVAMEEESFRKQFELI
jgi:hypothetical protein